MHPRSSTLSVPTASIQFAHLNTLPVSHLLLAIFRCPASPTSRPVIAILLLLSGNIHLNPGPTDIHVSLHTLNFRSLFPPNRSSYINDVIQTNNPDIFAITESWHNLNTTTPAQLISITPPGFQLFSVPRSPPASCGGVAFLCRDLLSPTNFNPYLVTIPSRPPPFTSQTFLIR